MLDKNDKKSIDDIIHDGDWDFPEKAIAALMRRVAAGRDIFDQQRLKTLRILAAQAAISIENAKLYLGLQQSEQAYRSLYENAIAFEFRELGPDTPEHIGQWLQHWPLGKFPLLLDGERTIIFK